MFSVIVTTTLFKINDHGQRVGIASLSTTVISGFDIPQLAVTAADGLRIKHLECDRYGTVVQMKVDQK